MADKIEFQSKEFQSKDGTSLEEIMKAIDDLTEELATKKPLSISDVELDFKAFELQDVATDELKKSIKAFVAMCSKDKYAVDIPSPNLKYVPQLNRYVFCEDEKQIQDQDEVQTISKFKKCIKFLDIVYDALCSGIGITKREIFYSAAKVFEEYAQVETIINHMCCLFRCTRASFNITGSSNGFFVGKLKYTTGAGFVDCSQVGNSWLPIPTSMRRVKNMESTGAKFILLVEKHTVFMRLALDKFYEKVPCILITGDGQPDYASRIFLQKMSYELKLPVLGLMDCHAAGIRMLYDYKQASKNTAFDSGTLATDIKWLGLFPSDLDKYKIPKNARIKMDKNDIGKVGKLLKEEFLQNNDRLKEELEIMLASGEKAEVIALSIFGFGYLSKVFLKEKIAAKDWI